MAKNVKLSDIAERLGVSAVTVSKALSGKKGVSEDMRTRIIQLANELGYRQPSSGRQNTTVSKSCNIAVLIHERYLAKYDSFYLRLYQYIAACSASKGSFTLMEVVTGDAEKKCTMPMVIRENKADAVIILGKYSGKYVKALNGYLGQMPYVYLDNSNVNTDADSVISDSFYGAYYLTNYLFEMGHTGIGFVGNILGTTSITDRYLGYLKSLLEHGVDLRTDWIIDDRSEDTGIMYSSDNLALPEQMPSAFVCNCDLAASTLIKRLENDGYKVPEDFSVVGYDNYLYPGMCDVKITTYEVDMEEMAMESLNILLKKMAGEPYKPGTHIIEGRLITGDSVKQLG
ncbi:LacI family transcriptional regulator [Lachnospiraceae bacterium C10]|jgi:LacI family transcriptional regulator/LacI family purine nucleotide synthesis repressor|nr:LacI family transcriptional regulator [Lachnospiraceae bacterium C10]